MRFYFRETPRQAARRREATRREVQRLHDREGSRRAHADELAARRTRRGWSIETRIAISCCAAFVGALATWGVTVLAHWHDDYHWCFVLAGAFVGFLMVWSDEI
jgi:hypothetical protein